ncbi:MAG: oligosaccharide flippase family protein [Methylophaga sp.]|nr:oligosaccharide flippase family protein [Methylophaga sp.]
MDKKKIITAGTWVIGIFGLSQLLRLGSNLVVTRLLEPEMFGLMAIVYVLSQGVYMFSDLGFWAFIVRHKRGTDPSVLNTVWTMQVIRGWIIFLIILLMAALMVVINTRTQIDMGAVYGNNILPYLLIVVAFTAAIQGYKTMAPAIVSRELKRGRLELIDLISQFCGIVVMLVWAWNFPSIWALVSAAVIASIVSLLLTYHFYQYRQKFEWDTTVAKEVYNFGKWIFIATVLTYLAQQGDRLIFASYLSAAEIGVYSIAFMIFSVFNNIIQQLTSKIWFPVLSDVALKKRGQLKDKYYMIRLRQDFIVFFGIGILIAIAPVLIEFLYDERYHGAGSIMKVLSFSLVGLCLSAVGLECLSALSITKIRMKIMLYRALSIFVGLPILFYYYGFLGALWGVVLGNFISLPVQYLEMKKQKIFSLFLELRLIPMVGVGYLFAELILSYTVHI